MPDDRFFAVATIAVRAVSLYDKFGMIRLNMDYAGRVLSDPAGMGLFLGVLLLSGKPYFLTFASVALAELVHFTQDIGQVSFFCFDLHHQYLNSY
jgi:hypothetical protein